MTPATCEIHHAQHTGGVLARHTDYWYQAVVTDSTGSHVLAETPRRRNDRARAAASRSDLAELEHALRGDGWEPVAGQIDGLPRFQRLEGYVRALAAGPGSASVSRHSRIALHRG